MLQETPDRAGDPFFIVGAVRYKAEGGDKIRMGMQLPLKQRVRVTRFQECWRGSCGSRAAASSMGFGVYCTVSFGH
eukprot:2156824-Prymnesium_polylepis.1